MFLILIIVDFTLRSKPLSICPFFFIYLYVLWGCVSVQCLCLIALRIHFWWALRTLWGAPDWICVNCMQGKHPAYSGPIPFHLKIRLEYSSSYRDPNKFWTWPRTWPILVFIFLFDNCVIVFLLCLNEKLWADKVVPWVGCLPCIQLIRLDPRTDL